jgi:hypothetical protein
VSPRPPESDNAEAISVLIGAPEKHAAAINSGILDLLHRMTRLGSILDQVVGHLGIDVDGGLEDKAAAILKHLQERK